ncbi:heterokaryon incompatibility protein-domain-containing protein [Cubamyces menziesii]|uniref:Vegetative incompatibility protein HET-E-1 n=1 Tax=Trametes cubensis TaxID=1111947 RepID=A0AAD7X5Y3_9APHY|nr:heterokaryon incompatibility protein-domain-containing protein [Cubamyces menziesii]KAJ8462511.1 hypothetical protein ONZ51_g10858 [Trametes cubensis]
MWLLRTDTFVLHQVNDPENVAYAILSHVWDLEGEQSFQDIQKIHAEEGRYHGGDEDAYREAVRRRISSKVRNFCDAARRDNFIFGWIDTCCIDKQSSAELSEAINSMYAWYGHAEICYAYLHDVKDDEDPLSPYSAFFGSAWFTRGWTLQELIAPKNVMFLSKHWTFLGTKNTLADAISTITSVGAGVLNHTTSLDSVPVATRMGWASKRVTTRLEDEAYSLMGLFGVNMPTLYGEGSNAFTRLQEEILKRIPDQSLFVWGAQLRDYTALLPGPALPAKASRLGREDVEYPLLASSPSAFTDCLPLDLVSTQDLSTTLGLQNIPIPEYSFTAYGIRVRLPIARVVRAESGDLYLAVLACKHRSTGSYLALILRGRGGGMRYDVGARAGPHRSFSRIVLFRPVLHSRHIDQVTIEEIYLTRFPRKPGRIVSLLEPASAERHSSFKVVLPAWMRQRVRLNQYFLEDHGDEKLLPAKHGCWKFVFSRANAEPGLEHITIYIRRDVDCQRVLAADALFHDGPSPAPPPCTGDHIAGWPGLCGQFRDQAGRYALTLSFKMLPGEHKVVLGHIPLMLVAVDLTQLARQVSVPPGALKYRQ